VHCAHCGTNIPFGAGGVQDGDLRFCKEECQTAAALLAEVNIPGDVVTRKAVETHQDLCPECGGIGPVDVWSSYRVWSALFLTVHSVRHRVCCRACGLRSQTWSTLYCLLCGWWSPFGLLVTPAWVVLNVAAGLKARDPSKPSAALEETIRMRLAADLPPPTSPETAMKVAQTAQEYAYVASAPCGCGRQGTIRVAWQALLNNPEGPLDMLKAACGACHAQHTFYFDASKLSESHSSKPPTLP
jgi:hypothetical protein